MVLSVLRITSAFLAAVILLSMLVLPVRGIQSQEQEITVRDDGELLHTALVNIVSGIGAVVCLSAVFVIVWKQRGS